MKNEQPILVALSLDHETPDIVSAAAELGRRLAAPVVVLHALRARTLESELSLGARVREARDRVEAYLGLLRDAGVEVREVRVEVGHPAEVVLRTGPLLAAQMILTGGGRPATVRRWVVGSVAEAIVRRATVPVWVARGRWPLGGPVLCPVDLSPESNQGLEVAVRMARAFGVGLSIITVLAADDTTLADRTGPHPELARSVEAAEKQVEALLDSHALDGVQTSVMVVNGEPAECIVDAADEVGLLVIGSRGYDPLVRDWVGPVTARALRHSPCATLMVRQIGEGHEEREQAVVRLAELYDRGRELLEDDRGEEALLLLERAVEQAPANAVVQEAFAAALDRVGRSVEATSRRDLAALIRRRLG